ncbi:LysE family transporter [Archaeoglobus sp.]
MLPFILKVVLISTSGALAPGPLTAATAASGLKYRWKGGFWISVGHVVVELPLVLLIAFGVAAVLTRQDVAAFLSFLGGLMLLFFSYLTARSAFEVESLSNDGETSSPLLTGIGLTALNPFFIAWWAGVGASLIGEALSIWGFAGIAVLYVSHVWLDFVWLILLAHVTSLSSFSLKIYKSLLLTLALLVALFGVDFIYFSITASHLLF